jgi:CRISPR system Cascade subunit CasB
VNEVKHESPALIEALFQWWRGLAERKGDRATLRRCATPLEVALEPAYQTLYGRLNTRFEKLNADRLAAIVGLLSHVKNDDATNTPPKTFSQGEQPVLSPLRFRRLLESQGMDELYPIVRRALPLVGYTINVRALAQDVYYWGERTKKAWAYGYQWPDKGNA